MASALRERLTDLPGHDQAAFDAIHERAEHLLRPSGALAWLDEIAAWVAGWQRTTSPAVDRPAALVFAADHGVAAATKVSAYPTGITEALFGAFEQGRSTIAAFAQIAGASVRAIEPPFVHSVAHGDGGVPAQKRDARHRPRGPHQARAHRRLDCLQQPD